FPPGDIKEVRVRKEGQEYRLKRDGLAWRIVEPFEAAAMANLVQPVITEMTNLRAERYEAHAAKELGTYGLDKPYLQLTVTTTVPKEGEDAKEETKEHVLLIGKPTAADAKTRFAKLGNGEAIVVVGEKLAAAGDRTALDLLDRQLLTLETSAITRIQTN